MRLLSDDLDNVNLFKKEYLEDGLTVNEMSKLHSCSTAVIQRFLHKHGIKRNRCFKPSVEQHSLIVSLLNKNCTRKYISEQLNVPSYLINSYVNKNILHKGAYSNTLADESWILEKTDIFWYFLGLFSSDGHLGKYNEVCVYQKNGHYLKQLQKLIGHSGKLYGEDKTCYCIHISSRLLHCTLESYGFKEDKRYNTPYINCNNLEAQMLYFRGLFDGDGSLYYQYISGRLENVNFQITTGSNNVYLGLYNFLESLCIKAYKESSMSSVGNTYYHVGIRNREGILRLFPLLYKTSKSICLYRKYKNFVKFKELIALNNKVDDIVEPPMKIGE